MIDLFNIFEFRLVGKLLKQLERKKDIWYELADYL